MSLYTFIFEFNGGTYVSQIEAIDEMTSMKLWLKQLNPNQVKGLTEKIKKRLINEDFVDDLPILIQGCRNVWCFGITIKKQLALVNFVKTEI